MEVRRTEVGLASAVHDLALETLVLATPDVGQLDPFGSRGGVRVQVDGQIVAGRDPLAERPPLPRRPAKDLQRYFPTTWVSSPRPDFVRGAGYGNIRAQPLPVEAPKDPAKPLDPIRQPARGESASWLVRTALCVEPRNGRLHVFMPPVRTLEDYLDIVAGIEDTADLLDTPIVIAG
jgi:uncharacterized protein (DUF2126 family)